MSKRKLYKLASGVLSIFIAASCSLSGECKKVKIDSHELVWTNFLEKGGTLSFIDHSDSIVRFYIEKKERSFGNCNKFELGPFVYEDISLEIVSLDSLFQNNRITFSLFEDYKSGDSNWSFKHFNVLGLDSYLEDKSDAQKRQKQIVIHNGLEVNGFYFQDSRGESELESFFWNCEKGLVRFTTDKGEVYELILE